MQDRLRKAIEAFTAEGPDDGPNDSAQERALAMLCDSMEDYNAEPVPAAWRWQAIKRNMTDYLKASADAAQELREAWEETQKPGPVAVAFGKEAVEAWAMGYTDETGTFVVEHCDAFEGNDDAADMLHDYSPAGLWYWEGYLKTLEHHAGDFDVEAVGKFYPTTAQKVRNGEAPETRKGA